MAIEHRETRLPVNAGGHFSAGMNGDACAAFFDDNLAALYAFIARRIENRSVTQELTASTLKRALTIAQSGGVEPGSAAALSLRLAAGAVVDHARRTRETAQDSERLFEAGGADAEVLSDEAAIRVFAAAIDGDLLRRAVLGLPEVHRRMIVLAYFDALEPDAVGAALSCSGAEVAVRLNRALRALRSTMDETSTDAAERTARFTGQPRSTRAMATPGALIDADVVHLEAALRAAGQQAALMLRGRTQPTRWFSIELRSRLIARAGLDGPELD